MEKKTVAATATLGFCSIQLNLKIKSDLKSLFFAHEGYYAVIGHYKKLNLRILMYFFLKINEHSKQKTILNNEFYNE